MAFRLFKNKRKGKWYCVRRAPLRYQQIDRRGVVRQTTGISITNDQHGVAAGRVAESMNAALQSYWSKLAKGGAAKARAEYEDACQAATKLGVSPLPPHQGQRAPLRNYWPVSSGWSATE